MSERMMGEKIPIAISCQLCGADYQSDTSDSIEDKRLTAAVKRGVEHGDWTGLLCRDCMPIPYIP